MKLFLLLLAATAAPAFASRELQKATCNTGTVCQLSKSTTDCEPGYFCDSSCNAGSGNSGLCNLCPEAFTSALADATDSGDYTAFNTAYPGCEANKLPPGADPECMERTCVYIAGTRKVAGRYECDFTSVDAGGKTCGATTCSPGTCGEDGKCNGVAKDCDDGNACTVDTCASGSCVYENKPDGATCSTGLADVCNDMCINGTCNAFVLKDGDTTAGVCSLLASAGSDCAK
jgi:hypothetical protein